MTDEYVPQQLHPDAPYPTMNPVLRLRTKEEHLAALNDLLDSCCGFTCIEYRPQETTHLLHRPRKSGGAFYAQSGPGQVTILTFVLHHGVECETQLQDMTAGAKRRSREQEEQAAGVEPTIIESRV